MRTVICPGVGEVSAMGFGCASLGSRISERQGRAAIESALVAGVTWFDVAPSYGDGFAERILGSALGASRVAVVTKVGIQPRPSSPTRRAMARLMRPLVQAAPAMRRVVRGVRGVAAEKIPLSSEIIHTSVARSLERLGRDHVAVLALHEPSLEDVRRDEVIRACTDLQGEGMAIHIGITGPVAIFLEARAAGLEASVAQFSNGPFETSVSPSIEPAAFSVVHSVFGVDASLERLTDLMNREPAKSRLARLGYERASTLLLDYAFATNPTGVVLTSCYNSNHLAQNLQAAVQDPDLALPDEIRKVLELSPDA